MSSDITNRPFGVFDSGIGGLTVLKEILRVLPDENTIYLGDTARVPYGIRSPETVIRYSFENTKFLSFKDIKILVIACNTASAVSLDAIKSRVSIPVVGVIEPGAKAAVMASKNKKIGVIGTEATIKTAACIVANHIQRELLRIRNAFGDLAPGGRQLQLQKLGDFATQCHLEATDHRRKAMQARLFSQSPSGTIWTLLKAGCRNPRQGPSANG